MLGCLTSGRDRFERELQRAKALEAFAVIVECSWFDIGHGNYKSKMKPHAALQSILAFQVRYRVPFMFTGDRAGGEYACYWFLQKYLREQQQRFKAVGGLCSMNQDELRKLHKAHYKASNQRSEEWAKRGYCYPPPEPIPYPEEIRGLQCGAKTRAGTPCKRTDLYASGRCKFHGGMSTGPITTEGKKRSSMNGLQPKGSKAHDG